MKQILLTSTYEVKEDKILVCTPYSDAISHVCHQWGGIRVGGCWQLGLDRLSDVHKKLGKDTNDIVEVLVGSDHWSENRCQVMLHWYVLASRPSYEKSVEMYADMVTGTVPRVAGSKARPVVRPSDDAKFKLWVPRDFARRYSLPVCLDPLTEENSMGKSKREKIQRIKALMFESGITLNDLMEK